MMALPSAYLSQELTRPLRLPSGDSLCTVRDAWAYITALPEQREMRQHWQRTHALLVARADVPDLSRQLELALFQDGELDVGTTKTHFAIESIAGIAAATSLIISPVSTTARWRWLHTKSPVSAGRTLVSH
jgi:hypothetical protein